MDETTKVLIGTISGFLIAFLAEPVKIYFEDRAKAKDLRIALYKEMMHDYQIIEMALLPAAEEGRDVFQKTMASLNRYSIRNDCYEQAMQNNLQLFYRLEEASEFNRIYSELLQLKEKPVFVLDSGEAITPEWEAAVRMGVCRRLVDEVAYRFYNGNFDKRILKGIVPAEEYLELTRRGHEVSERKMAVPRREV